MSSNKRWDYLDPMFRMDLTQLDRLPENTGIDLIDRLNRELNQQAEGIEDLFITIEMDLIDNPSHGYSSLHKRRKGKVTKNKKPKEEEAEESDWLSTLKAEIQAEMDGE